MTTTDEYLHQTGTLIKAHSQVATLKSEPWLLFSFAPNVRVEGINDLPETQALLAGIAVVQGNFWPFALTAGFGDVAKYMDNYAFLQNYLVLA